MVSGKIKVFLLLVVTMFYFTDAIAAASGSTEFTVEVRGKLVPVQYVRSIKPDILKSALTSQRFSNWLSGINNDERFNISKIFIQGIDLFGSKIGFIKFQAYVKDPEGQNLPGVVFMRGGSVAVLTILKCEGEEHAVLTVQPRVPVANFAMPELPAGMVDDSGEFTLIAAKELKEETGIEIKKEELIDLTKEVYGEDSPQIYPSPGGSDEFIRLFLYRQEISREELEKFQGALTGERSKGEKITLKVVKLADLVKETRDMKALSALTLYNAYVAKK